MKKIFFILFAMVLCLSAEPVSIEDAWQMVQSRNDGLKAKKQGVKHAQKIQDSATSMYLPQLTLNGSYTHLDKPIGVDIPLSKLPIPLPDYQLDLSKQDIFLADVAMLWPVFTGGQITAAQEIREAQVQEGRAHFDLEEDKTFVQLITYYYGVVMGKAYYETRLEVQKALELHFDHAKKLLAQGQIAKVELLNAQVKLDAAKIETRQALYRYDIVRSALSMIVKEKGIVPASPLFINRIDKDESYFIAQTLEPIIWLSNLIPSTPAIQGFLMLNQMGASFEQVLPQYTLLWIQVLVYAVLAFWLLKRQRDF